MHDVIQAKYGSLMCSVELLGRICLVQSLFVRVVK